MESLCQDQPDQQDQTQDENVLAEPDTIRDLVEQTRAFDVADLGRKAHEFFEHHQGVEGVVVLTNEAPAGLIMRNDYYQKIGSLYGRDLFMHRPLKLLMNARPLIVDVSVDIAAISLIAMNRPPDQLYDMVVVTRDEKYLGVVSIKRFMIELSKNREKEIELLKQQKEILHAANEAEVRHRRQIEEKSVQLREKNDSIKNLLDNAGQGFLSFGPDMAVSEEYSLECVQLFRGPLGGKNFIELIERRVGEETSQTMAAVFKNVFGAPKGLQQKVYLSLLPTELLIFDRDVRIEYKIIERLDQKRIMLILTDITEKKKIERRLAEERDNVKMIVKSLARQSDVNMAIEDFRRFVGEEAGAMVASAGKASEALAEIFRLVHTYKGDFAQYGLHATAKAIHAIEDRLGAMSADAASATKETLLGVIGSWDAEEMLKADIAVLTEALGKSFFVKDERFHIGKEQLIEVENRIGALLKDKEREEALAMLRALRRHNVKDLVREYEDYLRALAERLGKPVEPLTVTGDDVFVDKDAYLKFLKSLVHVFRNMIDHGIEPMEDRIEAGKREFGLIKANVRLLEDGRFSLAVSDDGKGIDLERVRAKAAEKGVVTSEEAAAMNESQILGLLFLDSFSTKDEVSALSGRGVGLSAVKAETERLGGAIEVKTRPGQGSKFKFFLPTVMS